MKSDVCYDFWCHGMKCNRNFFHSDFIYACESETKLKI